MIARPALIHALLAALTCLPGLAGATTFHGPIAAIDPADYITLPKEERLWLERYACRSELADRRELVFAHQDREDKEQFASIRCHAPRDREGNSLVREMRCRKPQPGVWDCDLNNELYRIDFKEHHIFAADRSSPFDVPGQPPENSVEAVVAILASDPRHLHGKDCDMPRYLDGAFQIACDGITYIVKRTCDGKDCRRTVLRRP